MLCSRHIFEVSFTTVSLLRQALAVVQLLLGFQFVLSSLILPLLVVTIRQPWLGVHGRMLLLVDDALQNGSVPGYKLIEHVM